MDRPWWRAGFLGRDDDDLTAEQLEQLRPYVVNLSLGAFSTDGIMQTSPSDVDAIFDEHLPAFLDAADRNGVSGPVPLVFWAHGGIVSERDGLAIARTQVPWWLENGAYPVHFVWETGFVETLKQLLGWRAGRDLIRRLDLPGDGDRPNQLQSGPLGWGLWSAVKESAADASGPHGGAALRRCAARPVLCREPGSDHGARRGHSAGAIFHSHFIPAARQQGVPSFSTLQLLAPALRVDGFRTQLLPMVDTDINKITVYTMNMQAENDDNCFQVYRKSLLYLVSQIFEPEDDAPILGLEQSIRGDPELMVAFGLTPGTQGRVEVVWSPTDPGAPPDCRSSATSHGGFDNDADTMNSVVRRVVRRPDIVEYPERDRRRGAGELEATMAAPPA